MASLDYVEAKLDAAGFTTTVQQFTASGRTATT
jgi:aminopeptidase S